MVTRRNFTAEIVSASHSVLVEALTLLEPFRSRIVVIGGWVPELLLGGHPGTSDVDLGIEPSLLEEPGYPRLRDLLRAAGYDPDPHPDQSHRFYRSLRGGALVVPLDLITTETAYTAFREAHPGDGPGKTRGLELAFRLYREVAIEDRRPDGEPRRATARVAELVPFLVMKANSFDERESTKDAYDICFCLEHWPGGPAAVAEAFRPHLDLPLVQEALGKLAARFGSPAALGPRRFADFEELTDPEERELATRAASDRVRLLLEALGVSPAGAPR